MAEHALCGGRGGGRDKGARWGSLLSSHLDLQPVGARHDDGVGFFHDRQRRRRRHGRALGAALQPVRGEGDLDVGHDVALGRKGVEVVGARAPIKKCAHRRAARPISPHIARAPPSILTASHHAVAARMAARTSRNSSDGRAVVTEASTDWAADRTSAPDTPTDTTDEAWGGGRV